MRKSDIALNDEIYIFIHSRSPILNFKFGKFNQFHSLKFFIPCDEIQLYVHENFYYNICQNDVYYVSIEKLFHTL